MTCLDDLPPALEEHPGMAAVRRRVVAVLATGIEERKGKQSEEEEEEAVRAGADALAKYLGPVAGMFEEGIDFVHLREEVEQLAVYAFKRLLMSESLQLQSENETYRLLMAWLNQSPHANGRRASLFKELAPVLRYHHMTPDILVNYVFQCSMMKKSGLLPSVLGSAFVQRNASTALVKKGGVTRGKGDRGLPPSEASWELKASFMLEEVMALETGKSIRMWCGVVAGYKAALQVERDEEKGTLGAHLVIRMPAVEAVEGGPAAGVGLKVEMLLPPDVKWGYSAFYTSQKSCWGYDDVIGKPWAEAVREGSPHFPGGKLEIKATVQLALEEK
jgi:hypothetical protein